MAGRRTKRLSIRGPVILFVFVILLIVTLTVLWNVVLVHDYVLLRELTAQGVAFHWALIALGSVLFVAMIVLSSVLIAQLIHNIRSSQRQSQLLASVSHELNSPLSSIKIFAQTLRSPNLPDEHRQNFVQKILFDTERLGRLISNILRAAETDHRQRELDVFPEDLELLGWLNEYIESVRSIGGDKLSVDLRVLPEDLTPQTRCTIPLDSVMFTQVLDNLMDNAIRYRRGNRADVVVTVDLSRVDEDPPLTTIRVSDQGVGVPRGELPRLFDRFYRASGSREQGRRGVGLGLHVVRSIVLSHGGEVTASSPGPDQGMEICITLPGCRLERQTS